MSSSQKRYPAEFKRQMVELVRSGRTPNELAREFEPSAESIRNWVGQAERGEGAHSDGLSSSEAEELKRLRRENRILRQEKEILKKPQPGLLGRAALYRPNLRVRKSTPGYLSNCDDVPCTWRLQERLLCLARPSTVGPLPLQDRKSTRLNSSHVAISYAVFCLKKKI